MKYLEGKMSLEMSMPISVQSWLGHELEIRGIDAVIYTRYIISLLQQERVELDHGEVDVDPLWGKKTDFRRLRGRKSERKKPPVGISEEEKKKTAAVECLLGISEEATDIEGLVEELFTRLKDINAQKENQEPRTDPSNQGSGSEGSVTTSNSEDPAERYYAAFPALQGQGGNTPVSPSVQCDASVWSKNPITNQLAGASQDSPYDATNHCGDGESNEQKPGESEPKVLVQKVKNIRSGDTKAGLPQRKVVNPKTPKHGYCKAGKPKKDKGLSRAARLLSWPPDSEQVKQEGADQRNFHSCNSQEKTKKTPCIKVENRKNEGSCLSIMSTSQPGCYADFLRSGKRVSPVSPEFREQNCWYTQPLDGFLSSTPDTKGRLFNRHSLSLSDQYLIGCSSSVESSPSDSPNHTKEAEPAFSMDIWSAVDAHTQLPAGLADLALPDFFSPTDLFAGSELSCLEQESWAFPHLEGLASRGSEEGELGCLNTLDVSPKDAEKGDEEHTTSGACLGIIITDQVSDLTFSESREFEKEIPQNHANFLDSQYEEKPCSQSSPSLYKAWGSLPLEDGGNDQLLDLGQNLILSSDEEHLSQITEDTENPPFYEAEMKTLLTDHTKQNKDFQTEDFGDYLRTKITSALVSDALVSDLDDVHDIKISAKIPEVKADVASQQCYESLYNEIEPDEVDLFGQTSPQMDHQPPDVATDVYIEFYNLSQISSPETLTGDIQGTLEDFSCFLSESSISLFGDLTSKPHEPASYFDESNIWSYDSPKKPGVFSTALFTDLVSPLVSDQIFMLSSPWLGDDAVLHKVWDTQVHPFFACKASPIGSASALLGTSTLLTKEETKYDDLHLQKVWQSHPSTYLSSPQNCSWFGASEVTQGYVPTMSIWLQDIPSVVVDTAGEDSSLADDTDSNAGLDCDLQNIENLWKTPRSLSLENLSKSLWEYGNLEDTTPLSKSFELVPSEHSAFDDVVPKKLSHVMSEPILKYSQTSPSLTRHAGDQDEVVDSDSKEHLFFSPKTHFRPIQTPEDQSHVTPFDSAQDLNLKDLFGGHLSTSKTPYQSYVAGESVKASFIPRFRVKKATTKYVQTGQGLDTEPSDASDGQEDQIQEVEDEKLSIVFDVLGDLGDSPDGVLGGDWASSVLSQSSEGSTQPPVSAGPTEDWNLRCLWSTHSDGDPEPISGNASPSVQYSNNIWSTGQDEHIQPLPKLPVYRTDGSTWTSAQVADDFEGVEPMEAPAENVPTRNCENQTDQNNEDEPVQMEHPVESKSDFASWTKFVPLPDKAVYSSELEQKWLNSDENRETPTTDLKGRKRRSRKPCSFFLEGHCRRSDCRFAHDMSNITCRFWEEGDCFKGNTCPFLHGYRSLGEDTDSDPSSSGSRKDSYEWKQEDFPSLSDPETMTDRTAKRPSLSKAVKKAAFVRKAWSTYRNYRRSAKQADKEEKESIPRKN